MDPTLPIIVLGAVGVAGAVAAAWLRRPENRYANLIVGRLNDGATWSEIDREITLRSAAVELRRRASLLVVDNPEKVNEAISTVGKQLAMQIASVDRESAKLFVEWVETASLSELLHPAAMRIAYRAARQRKRKPTKVPAALIGALNITD